MDLESLAIQVARSENLPVLPQIVSAVMKLADDPNASPRAMEAIIERDPALAAKILRVANSSYYGLSQVNAVGRAVSVLGMNAVRSLVVSIAYQQLISSRPSSACFSRAEFWLHSLATATACRIVGKLKCPVQADDLYGAGLMHDVGMLVLDRFCPQEFDSAITMAREEGVSLTEAEQKVLGFDHLQAGLLLVKRWGLSGVIADTFAYLANPMMIPEECAYVHVVVAADYLASACGLRNHSTQVPELNLATEDFLSMPEGQLDIIQSVVVQEVKKAGEAFQIKAAA